MHDSLESRIGGVWARCVATKWVHSLQASSVTEALLVGHCSGLPDVPILTKTISFKLQEAAGSPSLSARLPHLICCTGFQTHVDLSCCSPLLGSLYTDVKRNRGKKILESCMVQEFYYKFEPLFYVHLTKKQSWNMSALIPLGWTG